MKNLCPNKHDISDVELATALITVLAFQFMTLFSGDSYDLTDFIIALVAFIFGLKVSNSEFKGKLNELLIALILSTGIIHVISLVTYFFFNHGLLEPLYEKCDTGRLARIFMDTNCTEVFSLLGSLILFICFCILKKKADKT